jgi:hypothetical membrane protein
LLRFTGIRALLLAGLAAPIVLIVAIVAAGDSEPGYSHVSQFVSELGAVGAAHQNPFNYGGLFFSGLLTVLFALGMYLQVKPRAWFVASSLLVAVAGIGRLVAGVFPCDAGCAIGNMSNTATVHVVAGFFALTSGATAPLLLAVGLRRRGQNRLFWVSAGLGCSSLILVTVLFGLGKGFPYVGAVQRLALAAFYGWIVAVTLNIEALEHG